MANSRSGNTIFVDTTGILLQAAERGKIVAVRVVGGTAISRLKLYDGTDATGGKLFDSGDVAINTGADGKPEKAYITKGLYAEITGAAATAYIYLD